MEKLYLDLAYVSEIPEAYRHPAAAISTISGENLGNFAFRHALKYIVASFSEYRCVRYAEAHALARQDRIKHVLVSCANWLGISSRDEESNSSRCRAIEAVKAPVVCFGLGVQAKFGAGVPRLGPNTERLAKLLAERATKLSVRDQFTQDTLESIGISNTMVTGCPSNFINGNPTLGGKIIARAEGILARRCEWATVRSLISEVAGGHELSGRVLIDHLRLLGGSPAFYVVQSPSLLPYLLNETDQVPAMYRTNNPFDGNLDRIAFVLRSKALYFSSMEAWLDFSRTCDLALGMRIHGTMIPLQAEVPSILIAHDSRTSGLADSMGIPHLAPEAYCRMSAQGPRAILSTIADRMVHYDERRRHLAREMSNYLRANNLPVHHSLAGLAADPESSLAAPELQMRKVS